MCLGNALRSVGFGVAVNAGTGFTMGLFDPSLVKDNSTRLPNAFEGAAYFAGSGAISWIFEGVRSPRLFAKTDTSFESRHTCYFSTHFSISRQVSFETN